MNLRIAPPPIRTDEIIHALLLQKARSQIQRGFKKCSLSRDTQEPNIIFYQEEWNSWEDIERHIRSDRFPWILELMELSKNTPELTFCDVHETRGMEYVKKLRMQKKIK